MLCVQKVELFVPSLKHRNQIGLLCYRVSGATFQAVRISAQMQICLQADLEVQSDKLRRRTWLCRGSSLAFAVSAYIADLQYAFARQSMALQTMSVNC